MRWPLGIVALSIIATLTAQSCGDVMRSAHQCLIKYLAGVLVKIKNVPNVAEKAFISQNGV